MQKNKITANFDIENKKWNVDTSSVFVGNSLLSLSLSKPIYESIGKLTYGFKFYQNGDKKTEDHFPKIRSSVKTMSSTFVVEPPLYIEPNQGVELNLWARIEDDFYEENIVLKNIRPIQPYPSWTYVDGDWKAPIPRPAEGITTWDEEKQEWINLDHQYMPGTAGSAIK